METNAQFTSTCGNCRFFNPEGHIHGNCDRLNAMVDGGWVACHLSAPAFLSIDEIRTQLELLLSKPLVGTYGSVGVPEPTPPYGHPSEEGN